MNNREKVEKGLACCQVSMGDDEPFGKCSVCPYRDDGINVEDCRAVLCRETREVLDLEAKEAKYVGHDGIALWECPQCKNHVDMFREGEQVNYCWYCGQKLSF